MRSPSAMLGHLNRVIDIYSDKKTSIQAKIGSNPLVAPKLSYTLHFSISWWLAPNNPAACGLKAEIRANWIACGLRGFRRLSRVGCLPKSHKTMSRRWIGHLALARRYDHGDISHTFPPACPTLHPRPLLQTQSHKSWCPVIAIWERSEHWCRCEQYPSNG